MSWYPHATRSPGVDAGPHAPGYPPRGVLHTTEGTTYLGAWATYRLLNVWPHFTVSYERGKFQCWQHISTDRAARALRNPAGGVQTNKAAAVQIEIVGTCNPRQRGRVDWLHVEDFPAGYLRGIARLMRWLEATCGIRPRTVSEWPPYPASYGTGSRARLSEIDWRAFNGWCGHLHVPGNTHGDPGSLPIHRLLPQEGTRMSDAVVDKLSALYNQANAHHGDQTNQANAHHGDVLAVLDTLPDRIGAAVAAALNDDSTPTPSESE